MQAIRVQSAKYNGTLRDEYPAYLIDATAEAYTVLVPPGTLAIDHRKNRTDAAPDGALEIYSRTQGYHVWHICEQHSLQSKTYVHIALPAVMHDGWLKWIDLDLDFHVSPDDVITFRDQDEFDAHRVGMNYTQAMIDMCMSACERVRAGLESRTGAFDHAAATATYRKLMASGPSSTAA